MSIWRVKPVSAFEADMKKSQLKRVLGKWSLTAIGIGAIIGGGIFVLTGTGAYNHAGPALALSFVIAGIACVFAALCYSEFASILPVEGSAYAYAYGTIGEIFAWIIGWGLILEYAMGSMTVAVSWSGYFNKMLKMFGITLPEYLTADPGSYTGEGFSMNLPAFLIVLLVISLLIKGTEKAASANNFIVILKVSAVIFVIIAGAFFIDVDNWSPFIPEAQTIIVDDKPHEAYGVAGIISGAAAIFFAYVGFDAVSTQAGEAINPKKDVPFAIIASLLVCTLLYILVSLVLTGMISYQDFNPLGKYPEAIKAPVAYAFDIAGQAWAGYIITIAATVGLISVLMVMIMGQSRIFLGMSKDGLIPAVFSKINPLSGTPRTNLMILGAFIATVAAFTPISKLAEMTSFGTLFAFTMVCIAVWILRVKQPTLERSFKVPALPVIAVCGIAINTYLMVNLSKDAQLFSLGWLAIGMVIYFLYGKRNSKLNNPEE
ncbi:amino acid permease [Flavobacterium sp. F-328]|jgi:APA family basic amino acid/polyamine antiporter|uniref:Amino acid permease n=1 Tax=Flavobacterium erciyesense TaxID=2825842 RepID=A0ABS5D1J8_9FLAO|nr:amino acid permease [Flavobacterium erciyesense]MBQ0907893.1 amino acid permease [Flavobacterium erciyesense]